MEVDVTKLSPLRIEEFDDTLAFVHDNLSQDNPQTEKGFEVVDEEQIKPGVEITYPKEENQHVAVGGNPKPIIQDSSSKTSLIQEEIFPLKGRILHRP